MVSSDSHFLCIHGHFYQPPRNDPFSGYIHEERAAFPYHDFNEKITHECYEPNAEEGNFQHISFDLGPTLAAWLEQAYPDTYRSIIESEQYHYQHIGTGNGLAQAYNHTILPLASSRDKETQIVWGLMDFKHRYGHDAHGMWLPETAVDMECLELMRKHGITYTILAPWQASENIDTTQPYTVPLKNGDTITVFFYNSPLSGAVSFNDSATTDADIFSTQYVFPQYNSYKLAHNIPQIVIIATDGEAYGHHKAWRDKFLERIVYNSATGQGARLSTLEEYLQNNPPLDVTGIRDNTSWSCMHGTARWSTGCSCTPGDSSWKPLLRKALEALALQNNEIFEKRTTLFFDNPWNARNDYLVVHAGWETFEQFLIQHANRQDISEQERTTLKALFDAQYYGQCMFTSCGFFFEDLDKDASGINRVESTLLIGFARKVISLIWQATGQDLQKQFLQNLKLARSEITHRTGADLYRELSTINTGLLPEQRAVRETEDYDI